MFKELAELSKQAGKIRDEREREASKRIRELRILLDEWAKATEGMGDNYISLNLKSGCEGTSLNTGRREVYYAEHEEYHTIEDLDLDLVILIIEAMPKAVEIATQIAKEYLK